MRSRLQEFRLSSEVDGRGWKLARGTLLPGRVVWVNWCHWPEPADESSSSLEVEQCHHCGGVITIPTPGVLKRVLSWLISEHRTVPSCFHRKWASTNSRGPQSSSARPHVDSMPLNEIQFQTAPGGNDERRASKSDGHPACST